MKHYHIINVLHLTIISLFFISSVFYLTSKMDKVFADSYKIFDWDVATLSLIITTIGTFFAIFFRWRADVRNNQKMEEQARQNEARFKKLEYEIEILKTGSS